MWRSALLGLLVTATASCGKKTEDGPAVVAGAPVGTVVEIDGAVTANGKPLVLGATVAADDVVETTDTARVAIELAHNHARWTLGPHKRQKPRESVAWSLKVREGSAQGVDQVATSAGRDGERRAAETDVTTSAAAPPSAAAEIDRVAPAAAAPAAPPKADPAPMKPAAPGGPPPTQAPRPPAAKVAAQHASRPEPPMVQPPPPPPLAANADTDDTHPRTRGGDSKEDRVMSPAPHARQIVAIDAEMQKCVKPGAKAHLSVTCDDTHCTLTTSDAAAACLKARFGKLELPKASYTFELDLTGPAR